MNGDNLSAARFVDEAWGEGAVLFTAVGATAQERGALALALHRALRERRPRSVEDWIHGFESILVTFDCVLYDPRGITDTVHALAVTEAGTSSIPPPAHFDIPIVFGGEYGPDLNEVAGSVGMAPAELIEYLVSGDIVIGTIGGNLVPLMQRPQQPFTVRRMTSPRTAVPRGSLGLAGDRTCFYPVDAPGGWRLVGRTPLTMLDRSLESIAAYTAGDTVRLHSISASEWTDHEGRILLPTRTDARR